ncbi:MAG TPA: NUDIX domain-containing protein [Polyangiales bacterium]|nr:NUDIX domain-containing protein [Polyangiales bacterium]
MKRRDDLRERLERLTPYDGLEHTHKTRMLALVCEAADPFDRAHYLPGHVTASAFVVDRARAEVLLILHGKLERWLQPGGHVDPEDASVLEAARREVREETGLDVASGGGELLDVDIHVIPAHNEQPAHEHFDVRFVFERGAGVARAGSDAQNVRWVPIAQLLSSAGEHPELPSDESVLRALRKLRARWT